MQEKQVLGHALQLDEMQRISKNVLFFFGDPEQLTSLIISPNVIQLLITGIYDQSSLHLELL